VLIGEVSQPELALYQKASDALIMYFPDKLHYREFMSPMKMFEYMASNRPIITSDLPSVRDVLNEQNAFFVPPQKPSVLAHAIKSILSDPVEAERRANLAYKKVTQEYTWAKKAERVHMFLSKVLK